MKTAKSRTPRVLLMLPCYNEGRIIADVLREIQSLDAGYDTLVIDDGSDDDTFAVASPLSPTLRLVDNLGIGAAVHTAVKYAAEHCYDFCVQVDGDGQHPPGEVAVLLDTYREQPANLVIGSRFLENDGFQATFARRLGNRVIGIWLELLFGRKVTDSTSGFRLMDAAAIDFFAKVYPHDFPEPISIARAIQNNFTVREVPVRMRGRSHGRSSITGLKTAAYMVRVMSYILLTRLEHVIERSRRSERL